MMLTLEQLRNVLNQVEYVGKQFTKPDDDWSPVAFLFNQKEIYICPVVFSRKDKDFVMPAVADTIKRVGAVAGALVISQWYTIIQSDSPLADTTISLLNAMGVRNHPDRKEQVSVELFDGINEELWDAEIERYPNKPPTLKPWVKREWDSSTGRMANVLKRAFALAKKEKV